MNSNKTSLATRCIALSILMPWPLVGPAFSADPELQRSIVMYEGEGGYRTYRIPAVETAPDGTLLAFAEARKYNWHDPGLDGNDIDLVMKRSADGGLTWSDMVIVEDPGELWGSGNPTTIVDKENGRVWLFYFQAQPNRVVQKTLARTSDDNGKTWSEPIDLSDVAGIIGPGGGIRTREGVLIAPSWGKGGLCTIYSEDHGQTWHRGSPIKNDPGGAENQLAEISNGRILMDTRQGGSVEHRWMAVSEDAGKSWSEARPGLVTPGTKVQCAIESYTLMSYGADRDRLLWTGPSDARKNLVIRMSYDDGVTFPVERRIAEGRAAYSDITILDDESIGVLWEGQAPRTAAKWCIHFARLTRDFLEPPSGK